MHELLTMLGLLLAVTGLFWLLGRFKILR